MDKAIEIVKLGEIYDIGNRERLIGQIKIIAYCNKLE